MSRVPEAGSGPSAQEQAVAESQASSDNELESFWDLAFREGEHVRYWENPHPSEALAALLASGLVPAGAMALDLGCGGGREALYLASRGLQVLAVDSSRRALEVARRRAADLGWVGEDPSGAVSVPDGGSIRWLLTDVAKLELPAASIDLAHDRGCFHVLSRERRRRYAQMLERSLVPGGLALILGARHSSEQEGYLALDQQELQRACAGLSFSIGPLQPIVMPAPAGDLDANLVILRRH